MRKIQLGLFALAVLSMTITGCKTSPKNAGNDSISADSDSVATETEADTVTVDSIVFSAKKDSTISCYIRVEYPKGNDSLSNGIKKFIAQQLGELYMPVNNIEESQRYKYPLYKGNVLNGRKVVDYYGKGTMKFFIADQKQTMKDMEWEDDNRPCYSEKIRISKEYETSKYVLYSASDESYQGGAHGSYGYYYTNISKKTHKVLGQTVDTTLVRTKAMQSLLRKGILRYMKECGEDIKASELNNALILPDDGLIPLPVHTPWLEKRGVCFTYQQYEIAPYAAGVIDFIIPYKDIKKYLCKEAQALIE